MDWSPTYCCPLCKGSVVAEPDRYLCRACQRTYPIVLGIPDFRVFPDPYISIEDDYAKARRIAETAERENLNFEGWVRLYWSITPEVAPEIAGRFIRRVLTLVDKGEANMEEIQARRSAEGLDVPASVLEVGCGTGGFLVAARRRGARVVGMDIAFRWLVIARKRFQELGLDIPVVCACAEFLPFDGRQFDLVVAENVLEHVRDQGPALQECRRVLTDGSSLFLVTPNRFFIGREPHVRLWGVAFLPRRFWDRYVRLRTGARFRFVRTVSVFELRRLLRAAGFPAPVLTLPGIPDRELQNFSASEQRQIRIYQALKQSRWINWFFFLFGPAFHVSCGPDSSKMK